jgi:hypothetical protein
MHGRSGRCLQRTALALALAAGLAAAGARAEPLTTAGIGVGSCAKLAKDMNPSEGFNNMANALIYFWVQGYMSAANITTLESDSEYVDLAKFDETVMLPMLHEFCTKNPDKKPISLIDSLLDKTAKLSGPWKKGTIPWAAE